MRDTHPDLYEVGLTLGSDRLHWEWINFVEGNLEYKRLSFVVVVVVFFFFFIILFASFYSCHRNFLLESLITFCQLATKNDQPVLFARCSSCCRQVLSGTCEWPLGPCVPEFHLPCVWRMPQRTEREPATTKTVSVVFSTTGKFQC